MLVDITQIDNPKKLIHKGRPKRSSSMHDDVLQDLATGNEENSRSAKSTKRVNVEGNKGDVKPKLECRHCGNCFGTGHYTTTCKFAKDYFK